VNRSRCRLGADLCRSKEPCIRLGRDPAREGVILGSSGSLKTTGSVCCDVCSKRDRLVLNKGMTARLLQSTAMLPTVRCLSLTTDGAVFARLTPMPSLSRELTLGSETGVFRWRVRKYVTIFLLHCDSLTLNSGSSNDF